MTFVTFATLLAASLSVVTATAVGSDQTMNQRSYWPFGSCAFSAVSCRNTTVQNDLCCFNAPGGRLLQTQFWDYNPAAGPEKSWTIHGLWPDHCDGTYDSFCDPTRELTNVTATLAAAGKHDLLKFMSKYWLDQTNTPEANELFYEHEWNKHGTCISTLQPKCFEHSKKPTPDVVAYFTRTVQLFKTLPTFEFLKSKGIVPSATQTYTLDQIQGAIVSHTGHNASVGCTKDGYLNEMWYHYVVQGSVADGIFIHADPDGSKSTCPDTGIKYVPKGFNSTA